MALKYASERCPEVPFILKCDDDIVINVPLLLNVLEYFEKHFKNTLEYQEKHPTSNVDGVLNNSNRYIIKNITKRSQKYSDDILKNLLKSELFGKLSRSNLVTNSIINHKSTNSSEIHDQAKNYLNNNTSDSENYEHTKNDLNNNSITSSQQNSPKTSVHKRSASDLNFWNRKTGTSSDLGTATNTEHVFKEIKLSKYEVEIFNEIFRRNDGDDNFVYCVTNVHAWVRR